MTTPTANGVPQLHNLNVAEEAAPEELLSYKELLTSVVPGQDNKAAAIHLVFMFTPTGHSCYD